MKPKIVAEYIWLDYQSQFRSKIRVLKGGNYDIVNMPHWNFDGSSTGQAPSNNSEVILKPVAVYNNPFLTNGLIVLCDLHVYIENVGIVPHSTNTRIKSIEYFKYTNYLLPWYGIEQEYYMLNESGKPFGHKVGNIDKIGKYYCGTAGGKIYGRKLAEKHMDYCLKAGLKISGINAEVGPSQWEFQIGPVEGIEGADQLLVARYILLRLAEEEGVMISFEPKPLGEEWPGSGCHVNFSTIKTRLPGGYEEIIRIIDNLSKTHQRFITFCGAGTEKRLTGEHETAMMTTFTTGVGSRTTSVRIPKEIYILQCGYFEDRRPSANMDPYLICGELMAAAL